MQGLPLLPGNSFRDPTENKFHLSQAFDIKNGFRIPRNKLFAPGGKPICHQQPQIADVNDLGSFDPSLTYGPAKDPAPPPFLPSFCAYDKKALHFKGYFKQTVVESPKESYRVRFVDFYYFLDDDSMCVVENPVDNSGMPQGKLIARHRIPKDDQGGCYHWKDLRLGKEICIYGKVFFLTDCDAFSREFLKSEGIDVGQPHSTPPDPYTQGRALGVPNLTYETKRVEDDKLAKFLKNDKKVLRFYVMGGDSKCLEDLIRYIIHFYLADDTVEIVEVNTPNDGRDGFPIMLRRQRVAKQWDNIPLDFPSIAMESMESEFKAYLTAEDFVPGKTVHILNRKFLVYDVDGFTRRYMCDMLGLTDLPKVDLPTSGHQCPKPIIPPYTGYGEVEDTLHNLYRTVIQPPKKDVARILVRTEVMRFEARMVSPYAQDDGRRVVITLYLGDDTLAVYESSRRNSGRVEGPFLKRGRVLLPGTTNNNPVYYLPKHFYPGAVVELSGRRFIITSADKNIMEMARKYPDVMPAEQLQAWRCHFDRCGPFDPAPEPGPPPQPQPCEDPDAPQRYRAEETPPPHPCDHPSPRAEFYSQGPRAWDGFCKVCGGQWGCVCGKAKGPDLPPLDATAPRIPGCTCMCGMQKWMGKCTCSKQQPAMPVYRPQPDKPHRDGDPLPPCCKCNNPAGCSCGRRGCLDPCADVYQPPPPPEMPYPPTDPPSTYRDPTSCRATTPLPPCPKYPDGYDPMAYKGSFERSTMPLHASMGVGDRERDARAIFGNSPQDCNEFDSQAMGLGSPPLGCCAPVTGGAPVAGNEGMRSSEPKPCCK